MTTGYWHATHAHTRAHTHTHTHTRARQRTCVVSTPLPPRAVPFHPRCARRGQYAERAPAAEVAARLARMPPSLRAALMPFQAEGVAFGLARHGRVLIADEMGVGKTVQAIALAACYEVGAGGWGLGGGGWRGAGERGSWGLRKDWYREV